MTEREQILESMTQELRRGMIVLGVMSQLRQPQYGYSLASQLKEKGLEVEQNTLYPLLRRLEKQNLLDSTWSLEDSRQRRYYQLSALGLEILKDLAAEWKKMSQTFEMLIAE